MIIVDSDFLDKEQRKDKREGAKLGLEIAKELDKSSEWSIINFNQN